MLSAPEHFVAKLNALDPWCHQFLRSKVQANKLTISHTTWRIDCRRQLTERIIHWKRCAFFSFVQFGLMIVAILLPFRLRYPSTGRNSTSRNFCYIKWKWERPIHIISGDVEREKLKIITIYMCVWVCVFMRADIWHDLTSHRVYLRTKMCVCASGSWNVESLRPKKAMSYFRVVKRFNSFYRLFASYLLCFVISDKCYN